MYQGVILAAGHGARLGSFGQQNPKPIVPIANKPLIAYQIEALKQIGITDIIILIGHLGYRIIQTIGDGGEWGVNIRYVEQEKRLGLAHAVGQLEPYISSPFLLILGDIFFHAPQLSQMCEIMKKEACACILATKEEQNFEVIRKNFSVQINSEGYVTRVIEKPKYPQTKIKGCGIYLFDERIFEGIHRTPRTALRDEYELTDSIQILIDLGYSVKALPIVEWDVNLTYIKDLITCCHLELTRQGKNMIQGKNCKVGENCSIVYSVLGDNVEIGDNCNLDKCVILNNVSIPSNTNLKDSVISTEGILE
ncbi:MAG TPA: sugar phosphate nucleotidyltransferase [Candidatus Hydrogenedens sp.]|nr:sugar phosphate nucleotidyltransferase [Candidatus Hydrogenedens sp.]HOL18879.1 sugar phosphate nucleotidyltransferase [Candidatus Hydrogenedens sp.]HPP57621.1 sugar phosphate nucleotidyltransferase [Candidatus Hydrogenedens sp.]